MNRNRKTIACLTVMLIAALLPAVAFAAVSVSVSPSTAQVQPGGQVQFLATVTGTTNSVVNWSLSGPSCSGNACGHITATGLYTAPAAAPKPNVVTVTATSLADLSKSGQAAVIIGSSSDIVVTVSPSAATVVVGQQQRFTAAVSGTTITGVTWSVACGGGACGTITRDGLYVAPSTVPSPSQVKVVATSVADPSKSGSATVTVAPPVAVGVSPKAARVVTGAQRQFIATVTGSTDHTVTWTLSGAGCSGSACGTITTNGLYTAPGTIPSPAQVTVTATSVADPTKSDSATVTVVQPIVVTISPKTAQVVAGATKQFSATVTGTSNTGVTWSLTGNGCSGTACGTISSTGLYTAPDQVSNSLQVFVTATSMADLSRSDTATVTVVPLIAVSVSPTSAQVVVAAQRQFTATVTGTANHSVTWTLSGAGCSGTACGTISPTGLYTAPGAVPSPAQVTVTATSVADTSKSGSATVTITPTVAVNVTPKTADVLIGTQLQFTATVTGNPNNNVTWTLAGTGCSGAACGTITSTGLYTAPNAVPNPPQVFVTATSSADPTKSGTATVTIVPPVGVSVSPKTATVPAGGQQQFTATVNGTSNHNVTWSLSGTGCSGAACGTITSTGLYTAPGTAPSPAQVNVTATSIADPTKSGTAVVTVTGPISVSVSPASAQVVTGAHQQFTATVTGTTIKGVTWTLSGAGCSGATCGTITSTGLYTAPATIPKPAQVTVTATSVADNTQSGSGTVTVTGPVFVTVSPKIASVVVGTQQQFTATVTGLSNHGVTWSVSGVGCSGTICGTINSAGLYTAPKAIPNVTQVFVTATAVGDPTKSGTASVKIVPPVGISISPTSATVPVGDHRQFLATVTGTGDTSVTWSVSGAGCSGAACGTIDSGGRYAAPVTVPNPPVVTVRVTSVADPSKFATADVTILPGLVVKVSPTTAQVRTDNQQQFTATVTGSTHTGVTWKVSGAGCSGAACGTITSTGLYTAPDTVPNPAQVTVTATSTFDFSKSDSATVTILPAIAVTVAPPTAQVVVGMVKHFIATVTGTANTAVTWSVSGVGCSGSACGTITSAGFYTAPATVPNPAKVTVTATSVADNTKSASAVVTIIHPVVVTISPTSANVAVNGQQQFQATVMGSTNNGVVWSVSGAGCSGVGCGTITPGGLFTAPASVPSPAIVIVTASSQIDITQSASAAVTIVPSENSKLEGRFAFMFTGFDSGGVYQAAGSFVADGNGNITSGHEDVNDTAGPGTNLLISGTYQVESNNRGLLKLSSTLGTQQFKFALDVLGTKGRFIAFDTTGIRGSGVFERQDPSAFSTSALTGSFALSLTGKDGAGARIGALAVILPDGFGGIAGGSMDVNDGGTLLETLGVNGSYAISDTGRGTLTLAVPGFAGGTFHFAIYIVSTGKFYMVSTDQLSSNNPIFGGPAEMQIGAPFRSSNFNGESIFSLGGASGNVSQVTVGRIFFDGRSQLLLQFDENTGGTVTTNNVLTGAYDVQLNGRGTFNLDNSKGLAKVWIMYAVAPNEAFVMDASTSFVDMGEVHLQTTKPPFNNSDIVGTYVLGSGEPLVPTAPLFSGSTSFDGKANAQNLGFVSGIEDISRSSGLSPDQTLSGAYTVSKSNTGRGTLLLTAPNGTTIALWITSPSEVVGVEIDATNSQPIVLHFEQ